MKKFVGGNWKSNNTLEASKALTHMLNSLAFKNVQVVVSPPFLHIPIVQQHLHKHIKIAAQNCSHQGFGAFTGQISSLHLKDAGVQWVILGHSERRTIFAESDKFISDKVAVALKNGLSVIACFGETLDQRTNQKTFEVLQRQLDALIPAVGTNWSKVVFAYEPVWAIGTGKTASCAQVEQVHKWIRQYLSAKGEQSRQCRIIYGGSVTQSNCKQLQAVANVDGFLVGGASLKQSFKVIVESCDHA